MRRFKMHLRGPTFLLLGFFLGFGGEGEGVFFIVPPRGGPGPGHFFNVPKWFPMVPIASHFHPICFEFGVLLINFGN
jgi:hypothetical protein